MVLFTETGKWGEGRGYLLGVSEDLDNFQNECVMLSLSSVGMCVCVRVCV